MSKRRLSLSMVVCTIFLLVLTSMVAAQSWPLEIGIYTTTDMHGRVYGLDPITGGAVKNSFLKVASAVQQERALVNGIILIDNGDIIQGTPITSYNINVENGWENPLGICLRYIGYDAFNLGNHEFNYTMEIQDRFYNILKDTTQAYPGDYVSVLSANYIDLVTQKTRMTPYIIKTFKTPEREFKVGIIGFTNVSIPSWDLPSHYAGADFVHQENKERSLAYEWTTYWEKQLREVEKCDLIIVASHAGEGTVVDNQPQDAQHQMAHFVANTAGIDIVIAGHDHAPKAKVLKNKLGEDVVFLNGGGDILAKVVVEVAKDGSFKIREPEALALADYPDHPGLEELMQPYYDKTVPFVNQQIGTLAGKWDDISDFHYTQGDTYDLVHKAQIWASGADVSITTPVGVRGFSISDLFPAGAEKAPISLKDCYSFYRFDNNLLYMIELTGKQFKAWLERTSETYRVEDNKVVGGGYGTDIAYGVDYEVYVGNPPGQRVQNVFYKGQPLKDDQILKVALSSYRLAANPLADEYGWYATTGITVTSPEMIWDASSSEEFGVVGGSVPLIIGEYIKAMTAQGQEIKPGAESFYRILPTTK